MKLYKPCIITGVPILNKQEKIKDLIFVDDKPQYSITSFGKFYSKTKKINIEINQLIMSDIISINATTYFIVTYNGDAYLFYTDTLELVYVLKFSGCVLQNAFLYDKKWMFVQTSKKLYMLNLKMDILLSKKLNNQLLFKNFSMHDNCLLLNTYNQLLKFNPFTNTVESKFTAESFISTTVLIHKNKIFVTIFGKLVCLELNSLKQLWDIELNESKRFYYSPIVMFDKVALLCPSGRILLLDIQTGRIIYTINSLRPVKYIFNFENNFYYIDIKDNCYKISNINNTIYVTRYAFGDGIYKTYNIDCDLYALNSNYQILQFRGN